MAGRHDDLCRKWLIIGRKISVGHRCPCTVARSHRYLNMHRTSNMLFFFFQAEDGIRDLTVTGVQTCALPISGSGEHHIFPSASDIRDAAGHVLVTSYAVLRPDGQWSLMLVNKDQESPHPVRIDRKSVV